MMRLLLALALLSPIAAAQLPPGTSDTSSSSSAPATRDDTLRTEASDALEHADYPAALRALKPLVDHNPADPRLRFDLASTEDALDQTSAAEADYRQALALDPSYLEPHLALGLLLARSGAADPARTELQTAANNAAGDRALRARAYRALAHLDQTSDPAAASTDLLNALKLSPESPQDQLLTARLASKAGDTASAEAAYRRILARSPSDPTATAELADLLLHSNQTAAAQSLLEAALKASPGDPVLSAQLAGLLARSGDFTRALALIQPLHAAHPNEVSLTRLNARLLAQTGDFASAEPLFAQLHAQTPSDPTLADDQADALIHLKRFAEAQQLLQPLVLASNSPFPDPQARAEAASHLAFAASQNSDPNTVLQALAVRATVLPQSPATLFLEAISRDQLHQTRQAQQLYQQFLSVADGRFPTEEGEAHHRLIALGRSR